MVFHLLNNLHDKLLMGYTVLCGAGIIMFIPTLVKMAPRDLGKIPARSRKDSRRDPGEILAAGVSAPRRDASRDSWREMEIPAAKISRDPGENLAGIPGGKRNSRGPKFRRVPGENVAGILGGKRNSWRESCRGSGREAKFPAAEISAGSCRVLVGASIAVWHTRVLPRIAAQQYGDKNKSKW